MSVCRCPVDRGFVTARCKYNGRVCTCTCAREFSETETPLPVCVCWRLTGCRRSPWSPLLQSGLRVCSTFLSLLPAPLCAYAAGVWLPPRGGVRVGLGLPSPRRVTKERSRGGRGAVVSGRGPASRVLGGREVVKCQNRSESRRPVAPTTGLGREATRREGSR